MKIRSLGVLAILMILTFSSFNKKGYDPLEQSRIISENTYMDVTEVSNVQWREYMSWCEKEYGKESKEYVATFPDENVWEGKKFEAIQKYYLRHTAYDNYPVVGISYKQATAYCRWRANRINEGLRINTKNNKTLPTYSCRLPSKEEWTELATRESFDLSISTAKDFSIIQIKPTGVEEKNDITAPVNSLRQSASGFFNLLGNVAEMVAEKGIAKGGSWQHRIDEIAIEKNFEYTKPTNWIGFRCVLEKK